MLPRDTEVRQGRSTANSPAQLSLGCGDIYDNTINFSCDRSSRSLICSLPSQLEISSLQLRYRGNEEPIFLPVYSLIFQHLFCTIVPD